MAEAKKIDRKELENAAGGFRFPEGPFYKYKCDVCGFTSMGDGRWIGKSHKEYCYDEVPAPTCNGMMQVVSE